MEGRTLLLFIASLSSKGRDLLSVGVQRVLQPAPALDCLYHCQHYGGWAILLSNVLPLLQVCSQIIGKARSAVRRNESFSWLFVAYQVLILVSTVLSPATVILIIVEGLQ
jgi:hypothetical protein